MICYNYVKVFKIHKKLSTSDVSGRESAV